MDLGWPPIVSTIGVYIVSKIRLAVPFRYQRYRWYRYHHYGHYQHNQNDDYYDDSYYNTYYQRLVCNHYKNVILQLGTPASSAAPPTPTVNGDCVTVTQVTTRAGDCAGRYPESGNRRCWPNPLQSTL